MAEHKEGEPEFEDSFQKRAKLNKELDSIMDDMEHFYNLRAEDFVKMRDANARWLQIDIKVEELEQAGNNLEEDIDMMEDNLKDLPADDSLRADLEDRIKTARNNILQIWDEVNALREELIVATENEAGLRGNFVGTEAIVKSKWQRFNQIKGEIAELKKESGQ